MNESYQQCHTVQKSFIASFELLERFQRSKGRRSQGGGM